MGGLKKHKKETELNRDQETNTSLDLKEQRQKRYLPKVQQGGGTQESALGANTVRVCIADATVTASMFARWSHCS